jgi:hypothetical protein
MDFGFGNAALLIQKPCNVGLQRIAEEDDQMFLNYFATRDTERAKMAQKFW